jgi:CRP-like cAMP-binding protein
MEARYIEHLMRTPLFANIDAKELEYVLVCLKPSFHKYQANDMVTMEGHPFTGIGVVIEGEVKVTKTNEAGDRIIMSILGEGGIFGEMVAFSSMNQWPASVVASRDTEIFFIKPDIIVNQCSRMCMGHRQLTINLLHLISDKALALNRKVNYLSIKSMRGKLAKFLMEEYHQHQKHTFDIRFNRNELSEFLHVSRPSMSRELSRMKDEGILDYYQNTFRLINMKKMSEYASYLN